MDLLQNDYEKIRKWIYKNARPLDLARWKYHFEGGSKEDVLLSLSAYQNDDGGFGHGLELDCWNPNSNPMQTWKATDILKEIDGCENDSKVTEGILRFLDSDKFFVDGYWNAVIPSNNDYPHAPWWSYYEGANKDWGCNPSVSLAGFVILTANRTSSIYKRAELLIKECTSEYINGGLLESMHESKCFVQLYDYLMKSKTNIIDLDKLKSKLIDQVNYCVCRDVSKWKTEYVCRPSFFINGKDSIFYKDNKEVLNRELNFIIENLNDEGTWNINWNWNQYEKQWVLSENWWKAEIIINNLILLRNFGKWGIINENR